MNYERTPSKKMIALILVSIFLLVMSYFTIYEDAHVIHNCTGNDCPVCHVLQIAESFTKQVMLAAFITAGCFFLIILTKLSGTILSSSVSERNLIIDKVRIDD